MNNLEFNKVFAALLIAGIIAMLCGFIAKQIVHPESLSKNAVMIEVAEAVDVGGAVAATGPDPILALLSGADVARGQQISKACAACHSMDKAGKDGVGPHLWGVVGRVKDSVAGFPYSGELEKVGDKSWTYTELNHFLYKPKAYVPGTKMNFIGVKKTEDRAALIAYLRSLSDSPLALPSADAIAAEAPVTPAPVKDDSALTSPTSTSVTAPAPH